MADGPGSLVARSLGLVLFALGLSWLYWAARDLHPLGSFNDDAAYYLNALAWREHRPLPTEYPPGESVLLYLSMLVLGTDPSLLRVVGIPLTLLTGGVIYLALQGQTSPRNRALVAGLYLASTVVVAHATNMMAEVPYCLLLWAAVGLALRRPDTLGAAGTGLLLAMALVTRGSAWFVVLGLTVALLAEKRFRFTAVMLVACVGPYALLKLAGVARSPGYFRHVSMMEGGGTYFLGYFWNWLVEFLKVWGGSLFQHPNYVPGTVAALAGLVFLLGGLVGLRQRRFLLLCLLCYIAGHVLWPYQFARYWMFPLPIVLLGWLELLPERGQQVFAVVMAGVCALGIYQVLTLVRLRAPVEAQRRELYGWLAQQQPVSVPVMAAHGPVTELLTGHPVVLIPVVPTLADLTGGACALQAGFLVTLASGLGHIDVNGKPLVPLLPGMERRLAVSPYWKLGFGNQLGQIFVLTVDPKLYTEGLAALREAQQLAAQGKTREALTALNPCLEKLPDLPEARLLAAQLDPAQLDSLRAVLKKQPAYPEMSTYVADVLLSGGRQAEARAEAQAALPEAQAQGLGQVVARLEQILASSKGD